MTDWDVRFVGRMSDEGVPDYYSYAPLTVRGTPAGYVLGGARLAEYLAEAMRRGLALGLVRQAWGVGSHWRPTQYDGKAGSGA